MSRGAPDYIRSHQIVITVGKEAIAEQPISEVPILKTEGKLTTTAQTYQTLATWTVSSGKSGILRSVELASDNYPKTRFQITLAGSVVVTDWELPAAWSGYFAESRLEAGKVVKLEGKSSDGTSISLWGAIEGKEIG